ncbi:MAG TPA: hypothetical protein VNA32_10195, partial [Actinomycetota bacterium]|nr:hypothetical protein [Actinomycetota bacterium]
MATYTIFGSGSPSGVTTNNSDTSAVNLATAFYPFGGVTGWTAIGARFWLPSDSSGGTTGYKAYLWSGADWASATQVDTADFTGVTLGAWNSVFFPSAHAITSGSIYWIS